MHPSDVQSDGLGDLQRVSSLCVNEVVASSICLDPKMCMSQRLTCRATEMACRFERHLQTLGEPQA